LEVKEALSMLRSKPKFLYSGLTLVMSNPSRFDTVRLMSNSNFIDQYCFQPEFGIMNCDIRLMQDDSPFLDGTKCIMLLGDSAMQKYAPMTRLNTIHEMRGSIFMYKDIPCIPSYLSEDCTDRSNYEAEHNPLAEGYDDEENYNGEDEETGDVKAMSKTSRKNYGFWLFKDIAKAKHIIRFGLPIPKRPNIKVYPDADEVIGVLQDTKNQYMDFDIETDYEDQNLLCFAFTFGDCIYSVPVLDYQYHWAYPQLTKIIKALHCAIISNTVVAHNGHAFDFFVLAKKYRIGIVKAWDTMMATHRCFPGVEKSLGHSISLWTFLNFHKDMDSEKYYTQDDMMKKLLYCAHDVHGMREVRLAIQKYAKTIPGLESSIETAMASIRLYLICTLQGIRYDPIRVQAKITENDKLMEQYIRLCRILIGPGGMKEVQSAVRGKPGAFPGSRTQCAKYFHDILGYPVIFKSPKTGEPSLGKKTMFKLQIEHDNPVIAIVNAYRGVQKETGVLSFNPWRDDNGIIPPREKERSE
jgi:hypothetical protein